MKVIAMGDGHYVCTVTHTELEKYLNLYYDGLKRLKIGDSVDLSKGHDFHREAKDALKKTEEFINANQKTINSILTGISLCGKISQEEGAKDE